MCTRVMKLVGTAVLLGAWLWCVPAAPARQDAGEIQVACDWFGVGGACRAGEWTGVRVSLTDGNDTPRAVVVRIVSVDSDGDRPMWQREVTTNPGVKQPVWMYLRLPYWFRQSDLLTVTVNAAVESGGGVEAGRLLGTAKIGAPRSVLNPPEGMLAIIGRRMMGLGEYGAAIGGERWLPAGHERTEIVKDIDPGAMPDRWIGLAQFDVIVWAEPPPGQLSGDQAQAVREWVERGGHLVVVLPRVGQTWTNELNNQLFPIVPRVMVETREGQDLEAYRAVIFDPVVRDGGLMPPPLPKDATIQVFAPALGAAPTEAVPLILGPDGACVVTRRLVGTGMVTMIGLDLTRDWLNARGLPDPETFWHRVLGRRGEMVTLQEMSSRQQQFGFIQREPITLDRDIAGRIAKTGRAAQGVLIGLVVFAAYWLVAGPAGFFALRRYRQERHAWVGFVVAAGLFTAIAWGGATAIRPHQVDATHLTMLEHVYGQPVQRMRSWASVLVPGYGEARVSLVDPAGTPEVMHNLIGPWEPWSGGLGRGGGFPDARGYVVECKQPDTMSIPTRSTVKQMQFDWAGGTRWKMPRPVGADGQSVGELKAVRRGAGGGIAVEGSLVHELPGELRDVVIVVNGGLKPASQSLRVQGASAMLSTVGAWSLAADRAWKPGDRLDLMEVTKSAGSDAYFKDLIEGSRSGSVDQGDGVGSGDSNNILSGRMTALAFFSQLEPPDMKNLDNSGGRRLAQRYASHGWDLGAWFAQPCVIVVGTLGEDGDGGPCPVPLFVDDRAVKTAGRTYIRWVYPLEAAPLKLTDRQAPSESAEGEPR